MINTIYKYVHKYIYDMADIALELDFVSCPRGEEQPRLLPTLMTPQSSAVGAT